MCLSLPLIHSVSLPPSVSLSVSLAQAHTHSYPLTQLIHSMQVSNLPGFVGNRCIFPYALESMLLLEERDSETFAGTGGLTVAKIDQAIRWILSTSQCIPSLSSSSFLSVFRQRMLMGVVKRLLSCCVISCLFSCALLRHLISRTSSVTTQSVLSYPSLPSLPPFYFIHSLSFLLLPSLPLLSLLLLPSEEY